MNKTHQSKAGVGVRKLGQGFCNPSVSYFVLLQFVVQAFVVSSSLGFIFGADLDPKPTQALVPPVSGCDQKMRKASALDLQPVSAETEHSTPRYGRCRATLRSQESEVYRKDHYNFLSRNQAPDLPGAVSWGGSDPARAGCLGKRQAGKPPTPTWQSHGSMSTRCLCNVACVWICQIF